MAQTVGILSVSRALNVNEWTIHRLVKKGMPKEARGQYNLAKCLLWYIRYQARRIKELDERAGPIERILGTRLKHLETKAQIAEHQLKQLQRTDLPAKDVQEAWEQIWAAITERLSSFPQRIAPLLEGKTEAEMEALMDDQVRADLTALAMTEVVEFDGGK